MINVIQTKGGLIHSNHLYDDVKKAEEKFAEYAKEIDPDVDIRFALEEGYVDHENMAGHCAYLTWPELCLTEGGSSEI